MGGRLPQPAGLLLGGAGDGQGQHGALRVGVLDGGQAGGEGHQGARRHPPREGGHRARRRLLRYAHGRGGMLELRDGRKRLHGEEVERVHRGLTSRAAPYWQVAPLVLVFAIFFVMPLVLTAVVSTWRYNEYEMLPALVGSNYASVFTDC